MAGSVRDLRSMAFAHKGGHKPLLGHQSFRGRSANWGTTHRRLCHRCRPQRAASSRGRRATLQRDRSLTHVCEVVLCLCHMLIHNGMSVLVLAAPMQLSAHPMSMSCRSELLGTYTPCVCNAWRFGSRCGRDWCVAIVVWPCFFLLGCCSRNDHRIGIGLHIFLSLAHSGARCLPHAPCSCSHQVFLGMECVRGFRPHSRGCAAIVGRGIFDCR